MRVRTELSHQKYAELLSHLNTAHKLLMQDGDKMQIIDQDDRGPQIIYVCTDILVQWYRHSGVEYTEMAECITEDIQTVISDMLYHQEQEMRAQERGK